jgi:hypothetical protein
VILSRGLEASLLTTLGHIISSKTCTEFTVQQADISPGSFDPLVANFAMATARALNSGRLSIGSGTKLQIMK